jgi:hypothetical protein
MLKEKRKKKCKRSGGRRRQEGKDKRQVLVSAGQSGLISLLGRAACNWRWLSLRRLLNIKLMNPTSVSFDTKTPQIPVFSRLMASVHDSI